MARKGGRKRVLGERYACGKLVQEDRAPTAAHIRRAIGQALVAGRDPWLGTRLGWMVASHEITSRQAEAGFRFAKLAEQYVKTMGMPPQNCPSVDFERVSGRGGAVEDIERTSGLCSRFSQIVETLEEIHAYRVVYDVCVNDRAPEWYQKKSLIMGLHRLSTVFGL